MKLIFVCISISTKKEEGEKRRREGLHVEECQKVSTPSFKSSSLSLS
jgi:hypothetical protein